MVCKANKYSLALTSMMVMIVEVVVLKKQTIDENNLKMIVMNLNFTEMVWLAKGTMATWCQQALRWSS
jgi:hypothetical protein